MISKWILKERSIVDASFLVLLVSYEEDKIGFILQPGEGVNGWRCRAPGGRAVPGVRSTFWHLALVVMTKK